ncbi:MAG TPA: class I SAM-dependent methyltransferase [bacterium]|jgi:SAM-dependent methyltransferase|nr:class I SAM-dependent methyltransferase [bacterium]
MADVRGYFDRKASRVGSSYVARRWHGTPLRREHYLQTQESVLRAIGGRRFQRVVEIGAGPCTWTGLLAHRSRSVVAFDLSLEMLKGCSLEFANVARCCGEATQLPLRAGTVDAVCSLRALEYVSDKAAAVAEFHRVLRPGGYLLLVTKNRTYRGYATRNGDHMEGDPEKAAVHGGTVTAEELAVVLRGQGFSGLAVGAAVLGRTRLVLLWTMIRLVRRLFDPASPKGLPWPLDGAVESLLVTAEKS